MKEQDLISQISDYLDGVVMTDEERRAFEARLARDEALRAELLAQTKLRALLASAPRPAAPADFRRRVMERLAAEPPESREAEKPPRHFAPRRMYHWAHLAAAAVTLAVGIGIFHSVRLGDQETKPAMDATSAEKAYVEDGETAVNDLAAVAVKDSAPIARAGQEEEAPVEMAPSLAAKASPPEPSPSLEAARTLAEPKRIGARVENLAERSLGILPPQEALGRQTMKEEDVGQRILAKADDTTVSDLSPTQRVGQDAPPSILRPSKGAKTQVATRSTIRDRRDRIKNEEASLAMKHDFQIVAQPVDSAESAAPWSDRAPSLRYVAPASAVKPDIRSPAVERAVASGQRASLERLPPTSYASTARAVQSDRVESKMPIDSYTGASAAPSLSPAPEESGRIVPIRTFGGAEAQKRKSPESAMKEQAIELHMAAPDVEARQLRPTSLDRIPGSGPVVAFVVYQRAAESESQASSRGFHDLSQTVVSAGGRIVSRRTEALSDGRTMSQVRARAPEEQARRLLRTLNNQGYKYEKSLDGQSLGRTLAKRRVGADRSASKLGVAYFERPLPKSARSSEGLGRSAKGALRGLAEGGDAKMPDGALGFAASPASRASRPQTTRSSDVELTVRILVLPKR